MMPRYLQRRHYHLRCRLVLGVGLQLLNMVYGTLVYCYYSMLPLIVSFWTRSNHICCRSSCLQKFHSTGDSALGSCITSCCALCWYGTRKISFCYHSSDCLLFRRYCLLYRVLCHLFLLHYRGRRHSCCWNCHRNVGYVAVAGTDDASSGTELGWLSIVRVLGGEVGRVVVILGILSKLVGSIAERGDADGVVEVGFGDCWW